MSPKRPLSTRNQILKAALHAFSSKGYYQTRMDDVARRSKTSKGSLYFYFSSKEQLLLALLDRSSRKLFRHIDKALNQPAVSRRAKLGAALMAGLELFEHHRRLARLMIRTLELGPPFEDRLSAMHGQLADRIRLQIDDAIASGDIQPVDSEIVATVWVGGLFGTIYRWLRTGQPDRLTDTYPTLYTLLLRSIGIEPQDPVSMRGDHD